MLKAKDQTKSINFLEPAGSTDSVLQTSFSWLTTIGKWMLMGVQAIVLGAFAFRLINDGRNNDLTSKIDAQVKVLENETWKKNVIKYENLQTLLRDIKVIKEGQELNSNLISEIINGIPLTMNVESISISSQRVTLSLTTSDFKALRDYEDSLKNNTYYSDVRVSIDKVGNVYDVSINFTVIKEIE